MWLTGRLDQPSQKDVIFSNLVIECRTVPPGARLSYKLRNCLERYPKKERKEIVERTDLECAPLFIACLRGNVEVAEYLITICDANIEQKGRYEVCDDLSVHLVTPLWCASVAGKLAIVKSLIKFSVDVNSVSDTGSSPVRSACFMTHFDIVVYLVEHGADISKSNYSGGTCLINSVQSVQLCEYLIKRGADVNAQDMQNKSVLHYAIQEHRLETTKLLIEYGAKPYLQSKYMDDALQIACIKGAYQIFEYLIKTIDYSPSRIADAYELMGATFLDEHHDVHVALQYWRIALKIRRDHDIRKNTLPPSKPFQFTKEFSTLEELEEISTDQDAIRTQSLLIYERILGIAHKDRMFRLMYRGAAYADSLQYQQCIDLWLHALKVRIQNDTILYAETCFTAQALVRLYLDMVEKYNSGVLKETVKFEDAYDTLQMLSAELPESMKLLKIHPIHKRHQNSFDIMMRVLTHMLFVLLNLTLSDEEKYKVALVVNVILRLDPRTNEGDLALLHLAVAKTNIIYNNCILEDQHMTPFPAIEVVEFLLQCGANVNAKSYIKGYSPLYIASQPKNYNTEVVEILLDHGGHLDQPTASRDTPCSLLARNPNCHFNLASFITLQCLSAKVVKDNSIPYRGEVPIFLESFIELH